MFMEWKMLNLPGGNSGATTLCLAGVFWLKLPKNMALRWICFINTTLLLRSN